MDQSAQYVSGEAFARFAEIDFSKWQTLVGCTLIHKEPERGPGLVAEVNSRGVEKMLLRIVHQESTHTVVERKYIVTRVTLGDYFPQLIPTPALEGVLAEWQAILREEAKRQAAAEEQRKRAHERAQQVARERERAQLEQSQARQEFAERKTKYRAERHRDTSPLSPLNKILMRLESGGPFTQDDWQWLEGQSLYATLGYYRSAAFDHTGKAAHLLSASSAWRYAGEPNKALALTDLLLTMPDATDKQFEAKILTTRGGALCDLDRLTDAESCALQAVSYNHQSHYPHNLLGRIYIRLGQAEKSQHHFDLAISLGSPPRDERRVMERAMGEVGTEERRAVADYLFKKDPERYGWAKRYLSTPYVTVDFPDDVPFD